MLSSGIQPFIACRDEKFLPIQLNFELSRCGVDEPEDRIKSICCKDTSGLVPGYESRQKNKADWARKRSRVDTERLVDELGWRGRGDSREAEVGQEQ